MAIFARLFLFGFLLLFISNSCWNVSGDEIAIVSHPTTVRLSFAQLLENSQTSKPSTSVLCERVHIRGLSRYRNLVKYAHALKVKVEIPQTSSRVYLQNVEICFHSNASLGVGMCAKEEWQKLVKGAWVQAISPFENKFLDLRILGGSLEFLEVSTEEEFLWHRATFLALGFVMMTLAPALSESIVMYYSSAMAVGIILVILLVLFQGMKLLPTGRKSSLAIFIYSGVIGAGSFLLRYLSGLLRSVLVKMGISEDMYNPVAIFVLLGLVLVGAWLGFWGVHKFVLTEDGSVDKSVAKFVRCSIWIFSAVMIFQSSLDTHLATQALVSAIAISSLTRSIFESKFLYRLYREMNSNCELQQTSLAILRPTMRVRKKCKPLEILGPEIVESEYCPQAVITYSSYKFMHGRILEGSPVEDMKELRLKAKKHLSSEGWNFWYVAKRENRELRYGAPTGKVYTSLQAACKAWMEEKKRIQKPSTPSPENSTENFAVKINLDKKKSSSTIYIQRNPQGGKTCKKSCDGKLTKSQACHELSEAQTSCPGRPIETFVFGKNSEENFPSVASIKINPRGVKICKKGHGRKSKKHKASDVLSEALDRVSCSNQRNPRSVLSWLLENGVIIRGEDVFYISKNDGRVLAAGMVTHEGIRCYCCTGLFYLTAFEVHARSTNHRPSANIFLSDGRSLADCQIEACKGKGRDSIQCSGKRMKRDQNQPNSDSICSICYYGGDLLLCDSCPSVFHLACVGLEDVPTGEWFCQSCRCVICDQADFGGDTTMIQCEQCERTYHDGCVKARGVSEGENLPLSNWFCNENCCKIFNGLHKLLGKSYPTGVEGLTWTILRSGREDNNRATTAAELEGMTELHKKLRMAVKVLHECFDPIIDPITKSDLVTDAVFNKRLGSSIPNFWGFYTMLLQRGDKLISVATVRIFGEKVAEMPLIGTRRQYRHQGMCALLVKEIEKMLAGFGVEMLVLPACSQLLQMWTSTSSFGFMKMTSSERIKLSDYTLWGFQDTIMCQKFLSSSSTTKTIKWKENNKDEEQSSVEMESDRNSEVIQIDCDRNSEVIQMDSVNKSGVTETDEQPLTNLLPAKTCRFYYRKISRTQYIS